ncbi:MAG: hypothetical protein HN416_11050 [Nitrospina sp.]|jgi:hypothetical protein|nr:hypothetical protein [Nitrospina sp.]
MKENTESRPSLLDLFSPPDENSKGVFGLMCALSADTSFMESVLKNFTGLGKKQRSQSGHCVLTLFLNPEHGQLSSSPGLAWGHPLTREQQPKKIEMMHAKVALLGFGKAAKNRPDYYRLIVFTGNWTSEAVNNSINLVWYCDYNLESKGNQQQEASDLLEAVEFWRTLLGLDKESKRPRGYYRLSKEIRDKITEFLNVLSAHVRKPGKIIVPRFFSNLHENKAKKNGIFEKDSIGAQVIQKICNDKKRRNAICCGSGFFEQAGEKPQEPEILVGLVDSLKPREARTKKKSYRNKYLVINPPTSGAAGHWLKNTPARKHTWSFYAPLHPDNDNAPLHAKYIFTANFVKRYTSGLLYFGSGNLSRQGFAFGPGTGGNVEAGVFLKVKESFQEDELFKMLGIDDVQFKASDIPDDIENENTEKGRQTTSPPPPISSCVWDRGNRLLSLDWDQDAKNWENIYLCGSLIVTQQENLALPTSTEPNFSVELTAKSSGTKEERWNIPVFNKEGDFYSPPPRPKKLGDILASLKSFPDISPEDEDEADEPLETRTNRKTGQGIDLSDQRASLEAFPLHLTTSLVETIAQKNLALIPKQMPDWIALLRRALLEEMQEDTVNKIKSLNINFLDLLKSTEGFAPSEPTEEYCKLIDEIAADWELIDADPLLIEKE